MRERRRGARLLLVAFGVTAVLHAISAAQQRDDGVPPAVVKILDGQHAGWTIAKTDARYSAALASVDPKATPNVVRGDFDGNGTNDIALLIEYRDPTTPSLTRVKLVAFLSAPNDFRTIVLNEGVKGGPTWILTAELVPRGSKGYDLNTDQWVTFDRDSIRLSPSRSGPCTTFVYRDGAFIPLWTCD